jgi:hypothetical protein
VNILTKQLQADDKGWSSTVKTYPVTKYSQSLGLGLRLWYDLMNGKGKRNSENEMLRVCVGQSHLAQQPAN